MASKFRYRINPRIINYHENSEGQQACWLHPRAKIVHCENHRWSKKITCGHDWCTGCWIACPCCNYNKIEPKKYPEKTFKMSRTRPAREQRDV